MPSITVNLGTFEVLQRYRLKLATDAGSAVGISMNSVVRHLLIANPPYPERAEPDAPTYNNPMPAETIDIPDDELVGVASSGSVVWAAEHKGAPAQFVYQRCSLGSQYSASAKDLYAEFQEWCKETGTYCPSQRGFGMQLTAMGLQRKRRNGGTHWWEGIRIFDVSESGHPKQPVEMRLTPPRVAKDEAVHHEEPPVSNLGHRVQGEDVDQFGLGFKTVVGRPQSKDEVIQLLLDDIFSGALDRGIDLQLSRDGSGRWISFPDRFMSIRLQPRNKALLVTAYGDPKSFNDLTGHALQVKADRKPYSQFHVRSRADISPALDIIETSLKLRSEKLHGNAPRFEPMSTIDAKPLRLTSSFLAMPAGLDVTSIIGQQVRSQGANRCLIVVSNNAIAEEMRTRLFRRFSLSFQVSDSVDELRGGSFFPNVARKSLFIAPHALFKELRSADLAESRQETSWDMVAIDGIQELLKDQLWWDTTGRDLLKNRGFTRHLSIISSPGIFKQPEILGTIHDLLDQRPLPYWYEACEPRDDFKDSAYIGEFAATLPVERDTVPSGSTDFLSRTYFTQALTQTIRDVVGRMNGEDSTPVIRVSGHFGGGKTHTLMTLYHLVNNPEEAIRNVNVQHALQGLNAPDDARAFFINGADIGTTPVIEGLPPLWSELARQVDLNLFTSLVEDPDGRHGPPNTAVYQRILEAASPCVILVDETEAYIRRLNSSSETSLNRLGARTLNDLVRLSYSVGGVAVVFTSLETEDEYFTRFSLGGELELLTTTRTPVDDGEMLEVVKKRLFKEIDQETGNEVAGAYHHLYMAAPDQFDVMVSPPPYTDRLANAYPFHPQLIDLLSTYLQGSSPSSAPGLRRLLQTLAGVVADQWVSRQSAYSIQPSHLDLGGGWIRTLLRQDERPGDGQHRLAALDYMRERLTEIITRADEQGQSGRHTYNHSPVLRSVANAVFANILRPGPTTPSQICLSAADPDIRPEYVYEALQSPIFQQFLGH